MFQKLLTYSELGEGAAKSLSLNGLEIAVFRIAGKFYALKNSCPHQHFSMLHEGEIRDGAVRCPVHGWMFDLETGASRTGQGRVTVYPVQIKGNEILINLDP